ncbi:hypothetical protein T069G_04724 [Trichoderma breve]|uniref:Uncharacterized protein n=1 Tax=Trichoderma breve TaxID=2034170 RepID=A0A9W9BHQ2_9HYPO|nr:hypothetical protein T069G_04724 [Trichoderma breve]KAJ4859736.1 hypothetical protein T069G_04724 [Trichoderma breve]
MRLGQGYNSFLQLPCVDGAVKIDQSDIQTHVARADPSPSVPQVVSYNSRFVERISHVARSMNISAASYEAKFADSDLNAVISVKVINRTTTTTKNPEFSELNRKMRMTNETFFQTFGDCYISGFIEGGDLNAIISIKAPDVTKKANIEAALKGVMNGSASEFALSEEFASSALEAALRETETTITNQSFVKWAAESKICVPTFSHTEQYTYNLLDSYMLYKRHLALLQTAMRNPLAFRESKGDNHVSLDVQSLVETRKAIKYEMAKIIRIINSRNEDPNGIITTEIESAETWATRLPLLGN